MVHESARVARAESVRRDGGTDLAKPRRKGVAAPNLLAEVKAMPVNASTSPPEGLLGWPDQLSGIAPQALCQFEQGEEGWLTQPAFEPADVRTLKASLKGQCFLGHAGFQASILRGLAKDLGYALIKTLVTPRAAGLWCNLRADRHPPEGPKLDLFTPWYI